MVAELRPFGLGLCTKREPESFDHGDYIFAEIGDRLMSGLCRVKLLFSQIACFRDQHQIAGKHSLA